MVCTCFWQRWRLVNWYKERFCKQKFTLLLQIVFVTGDWACRSLSLYILQGSTIHYSTWNSMISLSLLYRNSVKPGTSPCCNQILASCWHITISKLESLLERNSCKVYGKHIMKAMLTRLSSRFEGINWFSSGRWRLAKSFGLLQARIQSSGIFSKLYWVPYHGSTLSVDSCTRTTLFGFKLSIYRRHSWPISLWLPWLWLLWQYSDS